MPRDDKLILLGTFIGFLITMLVVEVADLARSETILCDLLRMKHDLTTTMVAGKCHVIVGNTLYGILEFFAR